MNKIPKIIHQTWVGQHKRPEEWMQTWKDKHPDWEYKLWNEDNIKGFELQELIEHCLKKGLYHGVADLVRYEVLWKYGGFVAPGDSECLNPIDELIDIEEDCFACYQGETRRPGLISPHLACTKENKLMRVMIDLMLHKKNVREPWIETGNQILTDVVKELNYPIKIYPSWYFIPEYNDGTKYQGSEKSYATHKWYTTKKLWTKQ